MIKCEVVFDGDYIRVNNYKIWNDYGASWWVESVGRFDTLEQAIKWCLEN
jgi:hypothetical protein